MSGLIVEFNSLCKSVFVVLLQIVHYFLWNVFFSVFWFHIITVFYRQFKYVQIVFVKMFYKVNTSHYVKYSVEAVQCSVQSSGYKFGQKQERRKPSKWCKDCWSRFIGSIQVSAELEDIQIVFYKILSHTYSWNFNWMY